MIIFILSLPSATDIHIAKTKASEDDLSNMRTLFQEARSFMIFEDRVSENDVALALKQINADIDQAAFVLAEKSIELPPNTNIPTPTEEERGCVRDSLIALLRYQTTSLSDHEEEEGTVTATENLFEQLANTDHQDNPYLLHLCICSTMCAFIVTVIGSWTLSGPPTECLLNEVYANLSATGVCSYCDWIE